MRFKIELSICRVRGGGSILAHCTNPGAENAMSDAVLTEIRDGIAIITLNRPQTLNVLSPEMRPAFTEAICRVETDDAARCVVIRAAGDHFMAGGDIRYMEKRLELERDERRRAVMEGIHYLHLGIFAIRRMGKPVVASIQGAVAGFGVGLVGACDLAIAADDAIFTLAYCHIGASPDGGSSYFVARSMGMKQQFELAFLGDRFDANRARDLGLVNWVVPRAELEAETEKLAKRLAAGPTHAYGNAKKLFNASLTNSIESHLQMEGELIADSMATDDHEEGVRAFLAKRKPTFTGR